MYSFKPNINLLTMFSIVISYMISPGDNLANSDYNYCAVQLGNDHFDIYQISGTQHMNIAGHPIEAFKTPYGKVYHKVLNVHKADMYPSQFCMFINDSWVYPHQNHFAILRECKQDLKTYIHIDFCMWDLNQDGFNINLENSIEYNVERAHQQSVEQFNTSHGKAYHMMIKNYKGHMIANDFCLWLNEDAYKDHTEIWKHLIQDLTVYEYIGCFPNLHHNLCLWDIRRDRFILNVADNNSANIRTAQQPAEYFNTHHGAAYHTILYVYKSNMDPNYFCLWFYGDFDHNDVWRILKSEIAYNTCIDQLQYDGLFECLTWKKNFTHVKKPSTQIKTWHGDKYRNILLKREYHQTVNMYCEQYRETHEAHIRPPN